jgi:hypothetical protein
VVFEADQRRGLEVDHVGVDHDIADESFLAGLRSHVNEADAGEALAVRGLVVVAQELIAAADREHDRARPDRSFQRWLLVLDQVFIDEGLLPVLAATEKEDVDLVHSLGVSAAELQEACVVVAPLRALEEREDVAAVAVDVH